MEISNYKERLSDAIKKKKIRYINDLCFDIENDQILVEFWPEELSRFVLSIFQNSSITSLRGSDCFIRLIHHDFEKIPIFWKNEIFWIKIWMIFMMKLCDTL